MLKTKKQPKEVTPEQRYEQRAEMLNAAPDLESTFQKYLKDKGQAIPENLNLSLIGIEEFQRNVKEAQDLREVVRKAKDPNEKVKALTAYEAKKGQIQEYLNIGKSFEAGYREYIRNRNEYVHFKTALADIRGLNNLLNEPSFKSLDDDANLDERSYARIEALMHKAKTDKVEQRDSEVTLQALKSIYPEDSKEYKELAAQLESPQPGAEKLGTKKDVMDEIGRQQKNVEELWGNPMVRYFTSVAELEKMMEDYHSGSAVLETQSIIKNLNKLHEWEQHHQRTTIGGVLVGPPGVGKTTLIHHYLEAKNRNYVYIDMSGDVTRYLLFGSKSMEFKNPTEFYTTLSTNLDRLKSEEDIKRFVAENARNISSVFKVKDDEATVIFLEQLQETLAAGASVEGLPKETVEKVQTTMVRIKALVEKTFRQELASEFGHVARRNGWRDGMVIAALRRGDSILFDEFNKMKDWSMLHKLMTSAPGEIYYFADNDEQIRIPDNWKMYFTANIGTRYGGNPMQETLFSRSEQSITTIEYPPPKEELLVALTALSNTEGDFLRSNEDLAKLFVLIHDVFPGMRKYLDDHKGTKPVSYRTIRNIAEKLVQTRDPKSKKLIFEPTNKSFDEAAYEVLVESYEAVENTEAPREWVKTLTSLGLLLDDRVKEKVVKWIGEADYEERRKKFEGMKEDFSKVVAKIKGMTRNMGADMTIPEQTNF